MNTSHGPGPTDVPLCRVTVLVGHFGAGKTEIAANLAFRARAAGETTTLVDLDVVKPYLRSRLLAEELAEAGIELVAPKDEYAQADLPIVVPEVRAAVGKAAAGIGRVFIDVGGAEVGARVLGSIPGLMDPTLTDVLFVVNGNRPFAETPEAVVSMLRGIEQVSRLRVTALVSNTHLMNETRVETILDGLRLAHAVSRETALPVRFAVVHAGLAGALEGGAADGVPVLTIERHIMPRLDLRRPGGRRSSIV